MGRTSSPATTELSSAEIEREAQRLVRSHLKHLPPALIEDAEATARLAILQAHQTWNPARGPWEKWRDWKVRGHLLDWRRRDGDESEGRRKDSKRMEVVALEEVGEVAQRLADPESTELMALGNLALADLLADLSPDFRAVCMCKVYGWTSAEIGERLGISKHAVDMRWYKSLERLRKRAEKRAADPASKPGRRKSAG